MHNPLLLRGGCGKSGGRTVLVAGAELDPLKLEALKSDPLASAKFNLEVRSAGAAVVAVTITLCCCG